ncbi:acyl-CoA N-acyltransferase [Aspergillus bertholletiae]|uniref:Acyl-CoA N-acyltransferase n=1 Tax=Aspergillus bertholletiae TaxID=1226010 RepID=A0A5N7ATL3_9EURO|nr:acyl-CoA N-acyltransferase [Aspergillus bertholletiae]
MTDTIQIRRMQPPDITYMAGLASTAYFHTPLSQFLSPHRHTYPDDFRRGFVQRIRARYYNPRCVGFVAVEASNPAVPVGYAMFSRLGNDTAARKLVAAQSSIWNTLQRWYVTVSIWVENLLWPDRSMDRAACRTFENATEADSMRFWDSEDMKKLYGERWHAQSVVVSGDFRRRGIGKKLMGEVLQRAQAEGVVVGLEASEDGGKLYRSLGFELRGQFSLVLEEYGASGVMMWRPTGDVKS